MKRFSARTIKAEYLLQTIHGTSSDSPHHPWLKAILAAIDDQSSNTDPFETSVENAGVRFIPQSLGSVQAHQAKHPRVIVA